MLRRVLFEHFCCLCPASLQVPARVMFLIFAPSGERHHLPGPLLLAEATLRGCGCLPPSAASASAFFAQKLANAGHVVGLFIVGTRLTTLFFSQHQLDMLSIIQEGNDNTREVI